MDHDCALERLHIVKPVCAASLIFYVLQLSLRCEDTNRVLADVAHMDHMGHMSQCMYDSS